MFAVARIDTEADLGALSNLGRIKRTLLGYSIAEFSALFSARTTIVLPLLSEQDNAHGR